MLQGTGCREYGLSTCGTWARLLCGMWDPPGSGIEPMSPALAGRFLGTGPPEKSLELSFKIVLQKIVQSSHILYAPFFLLLTSYVITVHLSQLKNQFQYSIIS